MENPTGHPLFFPRETTFSTDWATFQRARMRNSMRCAAMKRCSVGLHNRTFMRL